ncbi:MAG: thioredoxin TrxC [Elioraea sp.]|nr:thioredoxin TrxC [Elioraea sp.]
MTKPPDATILVCPGCGMLNRIPSARLTAKPVCGSCRAALLPGAPIEADEARLARFRDKDPLPLVLDLWAPWCAPCRTFAPTFAEAAARRPTVRFLKLDTEAHPQAAARFGVRAIPTLIGFRGGREVARLSGAVPLRDLLAFADRIAA